jgi:restriction system protein
MYPVLRAVEALGGSAKAGEINDRVVEDSAFTEEDIAVEYEGTAKSIVIDRIAWARSYCKLSGVLESPKRSLYLLTASGREILGMPEDDARARLKELDRRVRSERAKRGRPAKRQATGSADAATGGAPAGLEPEEDDGWKQLLLRRLHRLTPDGFEEFVLYLLRAYDLELSRVGGSGDEGIDGIGTAPLSDVLSSRVAVQAKRYDPGGPALGREVVALFQRDASAAGAERAVLVTLGRFSGPARKAAIVARPTVDLIDGERLCELVEKQGIGVRPTVAVDEAWFDRFD